MIKENAPINSLTYYQIGGPSSYLLIAKNLEELKSGLAEWKALNNKNSKIFILGLGTNVLANDAGFDGLIIRYLAEEITLSDDNRVRVESGASIEKLNNFLIDNSISGFEWSGGLPGTVGGAVFGNAGAFGGETKDKVLFVETLDLETLETKTYERDEKLFSYRSSKFKTELAQKEIILSVTFQFEKGDKEEIKKTIAEKIVYRQEHQPIDLPSAGSTFKNVPVENLSPALKEKFANKIKQDPFPVIPAAVFIAEAGLIGYQIGDAQISNIHPNFIVNLGQAKAQDVEELINHITAEVKRKFEIELTPEIIRI